MWTPRRIVLIVLGMAGAVAAYIAYSLAFGSIDGLPALPEKFLQPASGQELIVNYPVSRTERSLAEAFGQNSPEVVDGNTYKTRIELQERGMVIACGPPNPDGTPFVTVSPISVAQFGKLAPGSKPGEVREVSTFHADRARLRFDRPVNSLQDLNDKAKLVEIELISNADMETTDPRRGIIEIKNNQRSPDVNDQLVIRTVGPLFYRVPEEAVAYNPEIAHIWTAASVEVTDRRNLPRTLRGAVPTVALARSDDLRRQSAIADILLGYSLPPPTITADGMKIYLQPEEPKPGAPKGKSNGNSVREILLQEKVLMNLWSEGNAGLPGGDTVAPSVVLKSVADSGIAMPALLGSAWDGLGIMDKLLNKSLLMIETPGAFRYDFVKSTARFDIAPQAPAAGQPNIVTVTRLSAIKGQDNLFCNMLLLDFSDPPGGPVAKPKASNSREGGFVLRTLTATGPQVFLSVESDGLIAQGTELRYDRDARKGRSVTTLRGSPAYAKRDGSQLWGGDAVNFADIVIDSLDAAPNSKDGKSTTMTVNGPGRLEFFDQAEKKLTGTASWGKLFKHEKLAGQKLEKLTLDSPGRFADSEGDFRLAADKIWLWLASSEKPAGAPAGKGGSSGSKPEKLIADGNVEGGSPEMIIQKTDKLFVDFRDIPPPKVVVAAAPAAPQPAVIDPKPIDPLAPKVPAPVAPEPEKEAPNPTYLSAAVIHANVARYPVAAPPKNPNAPAAATAPTLKYELETALCEERVIVFQNPDPKDPAKPAIGLLIKCIKLNLEQSSAGSVMLCTGTEETLAEVHFETTSLYGPFVEIDQPNNTVKVNGRGKLRMLSGADLNGNDLTKPSDLVIDFAKEMRFYGARARAEFLQNVIATQMVLPDPPAKELPVNPRVAPKNASEQLPTPKELGEPNPHTTRSTLLGHRLDITFDRPIYFNQMKKKKEPLKDPKTGLAVVEEKPKMKTAVTTPVPDDERAAYPGGKPSRDVYYLEEVFNADNKYVSARRLRAKQIDFTNRQNEQELFAAGEGELRILQFEKDEDEAPAAPMAVNPNVRVAKKPEPGEMKLTVVNFAKQMVAKDRGKIYQEAVFDKGATAYSIPTDNLNLQFERHTLPKKSTMLTCVDSLTVSTSQTKKDVKPVQWMVALGNAEFRNDTYLGIGGKVTYNGQQFIFDGTPNRLATLSKLNVGPGQSDYHQAEQLIYKKDGSIKANKSSGGTFTPGG